MMELVDMLGLGSIKSEKKYNFWLYTDNKQDKQFKFHRSSKFSKIIKKNLNYFNFFVKIIELINIKVILLEEWNNIVLKFKFLVLLKTENNFSNIQNKVYL